MRSCILSLACLWLLAMSAAGQRSEGNGNGSSTPAPSGSAAEATKAPAVAPTASTPATTRPRMNAAGMRNENVAVFLIDNNAVKESNIRIGTTATAVNEASVESQPFATEHGRPATDVLMLRPPAPASGWHGEANWAHQNAAFNARTFFQVGSVKPSHRNLWGGRFMGKLWDWGFISGTYSQRDIRGMVNGNVLVPLANERTPLATDPATRALVQKFLNAYPNELPNRPDFDPRALNTNSPQRIDDIAGTTRLDINTSQKSKLFLSYGLDRQRTDAFQLVAGQNPDTQIHSHRARITWQIMPDPRTQWNFGASFARTLTMLQSEPNAVGPRVRLGFQWEELGPDSVFPVDRTTNTFRYGASWQKVLSNGKHTLMAGGDYVRVQLNGSESTNERGYFQFTNNFGRSAIENFRLGTPSMYDVALGELWRGYRGWTMNGFFADRWQVTQKLQLYLGVRWMGDATPVEVNGLEKIPYDGDFNNFSPRVSFAWRAPQQMVVRGMYTTSFLPILPVTYQQIRNNPPIVHYIQVSEPNLVDPLEKVDLSNPNQRFSPTWLSSDLASPYSHQYNLTVERQVGVGLVRMGYLGSRTIKLLNAYIQNRAEVVPGVPLTSATVDRRRPDPRYYETRLIVNGGNANFDAGQVAYDLPTKRGFGMTVSYTFSKAIDDGVDFSATAAGKDILNFRSQWQYESLLDRRGLSNFDSTHAFVLNYVWTVPNWRDGPGWLRAVTDNWQLSGVNLWKTGTPLTLFVGSDSPGFGNVDGGPSDRPTILDPSILGSTLGNPNSAPITVSRDKFAYIRPGENRGNLGRNTFRKSNIWNWNASLMKQWRFGHEYTLQFRAESYNLSNTPQFDEPQRNLSSPSFGRITNTLNDGRVFQVGLRLSL